MGVCVRMHTGLGIDHNLRNLFGGNMVLSFFSRLNDVAVYVRFVNTALVILSGVYASHLVGSWS